jgi:hypothetical protein
MSVPSSAPRAVTWTAPLAGLSWTRAVVGLVLTTVLALSVHAVMLDALGVAYPGFRIDAPVAQFVSRGWLHALGLLCLDAAIGDRLRASFLVRVGVLFLLASMLTEALLRGPFMNGYCSDSYLVAFAGAAPTWLAEAVLVALVVAARRGVSTPSRMIVAAAVLGALSTAFLVPAAAQASTRLQAALASFAHPNWCELPYGWNVNLPAYASFLEPALAAFAMAALAWDGLSPRSTRRLLEFTLLVMLIRRQVIAAFVYMAYSDLPPWSGLAAMGQFTLEALALGLLTGLSWRWARRRVAR